jgi:hypothetical protein
MPSYPSVPTAQLTAFRRPLSPFGGERLVGGLCTGSKLWEQCVPHMGHTRRQKLGVGGSIRLQYGENVLRSLAR